MTSVPGLQVHVRSVQNEQFQGECTDLDSRKGEVIALVEFASERAPVIALGETIRLTIRSGGLSSPIEAKATVVLRTDERTRRCYSFRLNKVSEGLLLQLANRRGPGRLRPRASRPVRIRLLDVTGDVHSEAIVHDISATGLAILVEPVLEKQLCNLLQLRLAILLPDKGSIETTAKVRHRRMFGSAILYGLQFDGQLPEFMYTQELLLSYLTNLRS